MHNISMLVLLFVCILCGNNKTAVGQSGCEFIPKSKIQVISITEAVFNPNILKVCYHTCNCDQITLKPSTLMYSVISCTVSMLYMLCQSLSDHENRNRLQPEFKVH